MIVNVGLSFSSQAIPLPPEVNAPDLRANDSGPKRVWSIQSSPVRVLTVASRLDLF